MADQKISELTNLLGSNIEDGDEFVVVDSSASETKAITASELRTAIGNGDFTVTGDLTVQGTTITVDSATAQNIVLGDNDKMTFGAGSDLQIYHDGTGGNSYIDETGSGSLFIRDNDNIALKKQSDNANMLVARAGAEVELYHNGSEKLATTSTGIDVTGTVTADGLTVDGNVGIGVTPETATSTYKALELGYSTAILARTSANQSYFGNNVYHSSDWKYKTTDPAALYQQIDDQHVFFNAASGTADTTVTFSEAMRIDSSGNLLVGKTTTDNNTVGAELNANGSVVGCSNNVNPAMFNRKSSDGDIAVFRKDGSTVGSIGNRGVNLEVSSPRNIEFNADTSDANRTIYFDGDQFGPFLADDASVDFGMHNRRWKDLHLSGGVYLGGTASANKLDDYETGTWTPTYTSAGSNAITVTYDIQVGRYVKVGNMVKATFRIRTDAVSGRSSDSLRVTGLPFSAANVSSMHYGGAIGRRIAWGNKPATAYVQTNTTYLLMIRDGSEGIGTLTTTNDMATGANANDLDVTVVYQTA